jgi:hypothetical protein
MANFFRCVAPARKKPSHSHHDTINKWQLRALGELSAGFVPTTLYVIDFQMRAALICDLFASAFIARVHLSLSLSLSAAQTVLRDANGMLPVVRAHLIVVYIISLCGRGIVSAQRDVVFPLGRAANTINGCFFFFTGCI